MKEMTDHEVYAALGEAIVAAQLNQGFGSLSKRDMELLIFHHLRQSPSYITLDNYALANRLKTPESRVKSLRLAAALKHSKTNHDEVVNRVLARLASGDHKPQVKDKLLQISLEDPVERREFEHAIKQKGSHADYRLNAELMRVEPLLVLELMGEHLGSNADAQFENLFQNISKDDQQLGKALGKAKGWRQKLTSWKQHGMDAAQIVGMVVALASYIQQLG